MFAKIRNYMFTGLLVVMPLVVTSAVLWWLFITLTNILLKCLPPELIAHPYGKLIVRLVIPIALMVLLVFIGMVARIVFIRKLFGFGERLLVKIPLFSKVYVALKQISQAFFSGEKTVFKRVVLVEYPRKGLYSIGFVTMKAKGEVQVKTRDDVINIFVPTTPNPTSGVLVFARPKEVIELDMTIEDGLKLVISGGAVTPRYEV